MSIGDEKDEMFLDALSHEFASEVLRDDQELEKALGPTRVALRDRVRVAAKRAIGKERRKRLEERSLQGVRRAETEQRYAALNREELLVMARARFEGPGSAAAVQHRNLDEVTTEDLRTMLEDVDRLEAQDGESKRP
jgi:hypothetical protein